jgi:hypothetical protein
MKADTWLSSPSSAFTLCGRRLRDPYRLKGRRFRVGIIAFFFGSTSVNCFKSNGEIEGGNYYYYIIRRDIKKTAKECICFQLTKEGNMVSCHYV